MILDSKLEFSDSQDITGNGDVVLDSENVVDLGADGKDAFGDAKGNAFRTITWYCNCSVTVAGDSISVQLVTATATDLSTGQVVLATKLFADATAAGTKFSAIVQARDLHRYIGLQYTNGATAVTAGSFDSGMILGYNDSLLADK